MKVKEIKELIKILAETDITELKLERYGTKVEIKKGRPEFAIAPVTTVNNLPSAPQVQMAPAAPQPMPPLGAEQAPDPSPEEDMELPPNQVMIVAPMVGTFYRAPSPGADPFVEVNQVIEPGEVLCIIEAMKLMNEIESDTRGRVIKILVENGQPVEYGQPMFILEKV
ncbi:MAG TPA: acetyl-CoA carboxylase biotin carboxyl carrier protein [Firmicutes bacterium]|nr:acetyl-CoA carboxylase biotin carboxyl carrier protein [Bacillota bacterium]